MAKRRVKKRTHVRPGPGETETKRGLTPKSMVIRMGAGQVGTNVSQLSRDTRQMMEPDTASRLKERKANKLKDYTSMAGPLGVSHLLLFSKSPQGNTNFRIALTPQGPTFTFQVESYSLCKDIAKSQKRPHGMGKSHINPPLLVMNNFLSPGETPLQPNVPKHLESLAVSVFQSLFPPISPQKTPLKSIRRIMLLNREVPSKDEKKKHQGDDSEEDPYVVQLRHYYILTKKKDVPRRIRRVTNTDKRHRDGADSSVPNLGKFTDVADYILDPSAGGYTSASESEADTDAEVEISQSSTKHVLSKRELQQRKRAGQEAKKKEEEGEAAQEGENEEEAEGEGEGGQEKAKSAKSKTRSSNVEKHAVKLVEIGPRMKLRLVKVEEGVCTGRVMWHAFVKKEDKKGGKKEEEKEKKGKEEEDDDDDDEYEDEDEDEDEDENGEDEDEDEDMVSSE